MPKISTTIAGQTFLTKQSLIEYIKQILRGYSDYDVINEYHFQFMSELLTRHPQAKTKISCGLAQIYVAPNIDFPMTNCFYLRRLDGSETDFSYKECLNPTPHKTKIRAAFRVLVDPHISEARKKYLADNPDAICMVTGFKLAVIGAHVHHAEPNTFESILSSFLIEHNLNPEEIQIKDDTLDNKSKDEILDPDIISNWISFHNSLAVYVVCSEAEHKQLHRTKEK